MSYHEISPTITTLTIVLNSTDYSNGITTNDNFTNNFFNRNGSNGRDGDGGNMVRSLDGIVIIDVDEIITNTTEQGTERSTEERP